MAKCKAAERRLRQIPRQWRSQQKTRLLKRPQRKLCNYVMSGRSFASTNVCHLCRTERLYSILCRTWTQIFFGEQYTQNMKEILVMNLILSSLLTKSKGKYRKKIGKSWSERPTDQDPPVPSRLSRQCRIPRTIIIPAKITSSCQGRISRAYPLSRYRAKKQDPVTRSLPVEIFTLVE